MIDLEQEFQLLMELVIDKIYAKEAAGELTQGEAESLVSMVQDRKHPREYGWESSETC